MKSGTLCTARLVRRKLPVSANFSAPDPPSPKKKETFGTAGMNLTGLRMVET
jgi:hypothetical protein